MTFTVTPTGELRSRSDVLIPLVEKSVEIRQPTMPADDGDDDDKASSDEEEPIWRTKPWKIISCFSIFISFQLICVHIKQWC